MKSLLRFTIFMGVVSIFFVKNSGNFNMIFISHSAVYVEKKELTVHKIKEVKNLLIERQQAKQMKMSGKPYSNSLKETPFTRRP